MTNLKTGDVLHCRNNRLISRLIRLATKSKWSHTAIYMEVYGVPCIIEAQSNGVNIKTFENWEKEYGYYWEAHRNLNLGNETAFRYRVMDKAGVTGYDFDDLLIKHPWRILTGKWRREPNEDEDMYCSYFAMWSHRVPDAYKMRPDEAFDYCERNPHVWLKVK